MKLQNIKITGLTPADALSSEEKKIVNVIYDLEHKYINQWVRNEWFPVEGKYFLADTEYKLETTDKIGVYIFKIRKMIQNPYSPRDEWKTISSKQVLISVEEVR